MVMISAEVFSLSWWSNIYCFHKPEFLPLKLKTKSGPAPDRRSMKIKIRQVCDLEWRVFSLGHVMSFGVIAKDKKCMYHIGFLKDLLGRTVQMEHNAVLHLSENI